MNQIIYVLYICAGLAGSDCAEERELPVYGNAGSCWEDVGKVRAPEKSLIYCYPKSAPAPVAEKPAEEKPAEEKKP